MAGRKPKPFVKARRKPPAFAPTLPTLPSLPRGQRFPGFPSFSEGPFLTPVSGAQKVGGTEVQGAWKPPPVPLWWAQENPLGSDLEWMVYWYLNAQGITFTYQYFNRDFGFSRDPGGQVPDFYVPGRGGPKGLIIGVQGEHWHYSNATQTARSLTQKLAAESNGFKVVYVRGDDLHNAFRETMESALRGIQIFPD